MQHYGTMVTVVHGPHVRPKTIVQWPLFYHSQIKVP